VTKNRKGFCISLLIILGALVIYSSSLVDRGHTLKRPFFTSITIDGFSSADIPYCSVQIGNQTIPAKIDLGYEGSLSVPPHLLSQIKGKIVSTPSTNYGLNGKAYPINTFKVKKITMGGMNFSTTEIEESNLDLEQEMILENNNSHEAKMMGRIGWKLFQELTLLIDCKNHQLAICDSVETLQRRGFPIGRFTMTPFSLNHGFIEFDAISDKGQIHCVLDTGATWNMCNKKPENVRNNMPLFNARDTFEISRFQIEAKDFGPITFNRIHSPLPLDAIIGMEFFKDTMVIIDFKNQKLYFYEYPEAAVSCWLQEDQGIESP